MSVRFQGNFVALGRLFDGGDRSPVRGLRPRGVPLRRLGLFLGLRRDLFGLLRHGHGAAPVIIGGSVGFQVGNIQPIQTP